MKGSRGGFTEYALGSFLEEVYQAEGPTQTVRPPSASMDKVVAQCTQKKYKKEKGYKRYLLTRTGFTEISLRQRSNRGISATAL